jgi:hypothetical protein
MIHLGRTSYFLADTSYKVEVTVQGPDGEIIKPIAHAPQ